MAARRACFFRKLVLISPILIFLLGSPFSVARSEQQAFPNQTEQSTAETADSPSHNTIPPDSLLDEETSSSENEIDEEVREYPALTTPPHVETTDERALLGQKQKKEEEGNLDLQMCSDPPPESSEEATAETGNELQDQSASSPRKDDEFSSSELLIKFWAPFEDVLLHLSGEYPKFSLVLTTILLAGLVRQGLPNVLRISARKLIMGSALLGVVSLMFIGTTFKGIAFATNLAISLVVIYALTIFVGILLAWMKYAWRLLVLAGLVLCVVEVSQLLQDPPLDDLVDILIVLLSSVLGGIWLYRKESADHATASVRWSRFIGQVEGRNKVYSGV